VPKWPISRDITVLSIKLNAAFLGAENSFFEELFWLKILIAKNLKEKMNWGADVACFNDV